MNTILQKRIEAESNKYMEEAIEMNDVVGDNLHYKDLKTCFIEAADFALQNQWISVEEALPECDRCCLAMYEDGGIIVAKYENETWWWQDGFVVGRNTEGDLMYSSSCKVPSGFITHWMSIPSLKGGEDETI